MAIYVFSIIGILFADIIKNKKTTYRLFFLIVITLTFISAIRYQVGTDYNVYVMIFSEIKHGLRSYVELGFYILNKIVVDAGGNVQYVIIFSAIVTNFAFGYTIIKNLEKKDIIFALFIYVCAEIYFYSMNAVRQYFAISIILIGFQFLVNKKYIKYFFFVFLATLFHTVAIFAILPALISFVNDKRDIMWILNIIVIISLFFMFIDIRPQIEGILSKFAGYLGWDNYINGANRKYFDNRNEFSVFKTIVPNISWFLLYYLKIRKQDDNEEKLNIYMIGYFFYVVLSNMFYGINVFQRVYNLFEYYIIYLTPSLISIGKKQENRIIIKILIIIYFFMLTSFAIFYRGAQDAVPYRTIFSTNNY